MKANVEDLQAMIVETRELAAAFAHAADEAEKSGGDYELWLNALDAGLQAASATRMTINSATLKICPEYQALHEEAGYTNDDTPSAVSLTHACERCGRLPSLSRFMHNIAEEMMRSIRQIMEEAYPKAMNGEENLKVQPNRKPHDLMLATTYTAIHLIGTQYSE